MIENIQRTINQYELKLISYYRGRGAYICETDKGVKLLKEMETTANRTWFDYYVKKHLIENGFENVDQYCLVEEKPYYKDGDKTYILRNWGNGRECNFYDEDEVVKVANNLAALHTKLQNVEFPKDVSCYSGLGELELNHTKHMLELKKIRKYIRNKSNWSEYEITFLQNFYYYFEKAEEAINGFKNNSYSKLVNEANIKKEVCHGEYTQHNILITTKDIMTVNFNKSELNIQILDLYQLMRKTLEKNDWSISIGLQIIDSYNKVNTLDTQQMQILYYLLLYPEKFWKICNHYFNTRKSWKPKRSLYKLDKLNEQKYKKEAFLKALWLNK